jgi:hypothetical protein
MYPYTSTEMEKFQHESCEKHQVEHARQRIFQNFNRVWRIWQNSTKKVLNIGSKLASYDRWNLKPSMGMEPTHQYARISCTQLFKSNCICVDQRASKKLKKEKSFGWATVWLRTYARRSSRLLLASSRAWLARVNFHAWYHRGWRWEGCTTVYTSRWELFFACGRLYLVSMSVSTSH